MHQIKKIPADEKFIILILLAILIFQMLILGLIQHDQNKRIEHNMQTTVEAGR